MIDIDLDQFIFNIKDKHTIIKKNGNTYLFFRFEDFEFISKNILPKYDIIIKENKNIGEQKFYGEYYKMHKKFHKVPLKEENNIRKSKIINKFYTEKEINEHIKKWK